MSELKHDCINAEFFAVEGRWPVTKPCKKCGKYWRWEPSEGQWVEVK